jgi:RimJ/RimL family protein N-acetyltransferase
VTDEPPAPTLPILSTPRLTLEPVTVDHAEELAVALNDPRLYDVIGGEPRSASSWRKVLAAWERRRSPTGDERWLNWAVRLASGELVGYVQATVVDTDADIAYVVGTPWQGHGYATEAAGAMLDHLRDDQRVAVTRAWIADGHEPSERVARRLRLAPTIERNAEGERLWRSRQASVEPGSCGE